MDTTDAAFEAGVELDGEALRLQQERHSHARGAAAAQIATGGVGTSTAALDRDNGGDGPDQPGETSPLLATRRKRTATAASDERSLADESVDGEPVWPGYAEFAHLPWYRRPSIYWVIGPFFLMACAFGGIIAPKLNLILELVCREYISEQTTKHPGMVFMPVDFNDGTNDQCRIPEVQARVAKFTLLGNLIAGLLCAFTSPKLGELSDRYGRKKILMITSFGTICGELITIAAAAYPETFPIDLMLLSYALDGLTGSFIVSMSISNAYATDCTPPAERNVAFGYFHGCLFTGLAIGPIIAGYIVKLTGKIVIVFYILTAVHTAFVLFILFAVPESLSKKRQLEAREKRRSLMQVNGPELEWLKHLWSLNLLEPLQILWPTGPGSSAALRRNLILLSAVDTIVFGVAMGSMTVLVIYTNYQFGWGSFESGRLMSIVSASRVFSLLVILPLLTRFFRGKRDPATQHQNTGSDNFDLYVIRFAVLLDTLGYLGYTLSKEPGPFIVSGAVAALGGMASPTLQATLTKHVPSDRTGQLLGAVGLLHALARVAAPTIFNAIYLATVSTFAQTVFLCLCATFGFGHVVSWFARPNVHFDEKAARLAEQEPDEHPPSNNSEDRARLPIVGAVMAAATSAAVWLGLRGSS